MLDSARVEAIKKIINLRSGNYCLRMVDFGSPYGKNMIATWYDMFEPRIMKNYTVFMVEFSIWAMNEIGNSTAPSASSLVKHWLDYKQRHIRHDKRARPIYNGEVIE